MPESADAFIVIFEPNTVVQLKNGKGEEAYADDAAVPRNAGPVAGRYTSSFPFG